MTKKEKAFAEKLYNSFAEKYEYVDCMKLLDIIQNLDEWKSIDDYYF